MKNLALFACIIIMISFTGATEVSKCKSSNARKLESNEVSVSNCEKSKCVLRRNSNANIEIKITPQKEIKDLKQDISAIILGVPLPFPGIYGTSACNSMYDADGKNKVNCPLKAGETYLYRSSFKIHNFYPTVSLIVHWALNDGKEDTICFEIPARIK